ncbi:MAG: hypothetical protein COB77_06810 [Gammaproteobacteria bacterium]|nr:MAG: hypothetical protein COB77_06810 [Gammaproteobacteria bacterium]
MILNTPSISERRQSPRYDIELAIDLVLLDGNILSVLSQNISGSGLQIVCDRWVTQEIEPRGIQNHAVNDIKLQVITNLPVTTEATKFYASCRIMSVQRMSQNEYILNLAFIDFENGSEKILNTFLNQHNQKKIVFKDISINSALSRLKEL